MAYEVRIKKKVARVLKKLPLDVRKLLFLLIEDLKSDGPIQKKLAKLFSFEQKSISLPSYLSICCVLDP